MRPCAARCGATPTSSSSARTSPAATVASGEPGGVGGVFGLTGGLYKEFGPTRVLDTPISESAIIGAASGAAVTGMRPVAEIMFVDFVGVCFDQIYNQAAKFRYMFGGKAKTPMVIRTAIGAGFRGGAQHSQTLHPLFTMVPGLKVVMPANAYDAKGLLISAIRDDDPVIFMESKVLYDSEMEVPDEAYRIPFGEANVVREGKDLTFVAFGSMVPRALAVAQTLAGEGISVEVDRPAHDLAARRGHHPRKRRKDRPPGDHRREPAALQPGRRRRRDGRGQGLPLAQGADQGR